MSKGSPDIMLSISAKQGGQSMKGLTAEFEISGDSEL
jgi:hypothetical protein